MITSRGRARLLGLTIAGAMLLGALSAPLALAAPGGPDCTAEAGQASIDDGRLTRAVREFTCLIDAAPTEVEGYRGRIEARLLLGRYAEAMADYSRVTAIVVPVHPDAATTIHAGYAARLATAPDDIPALTGASFARWWDFDYPQAINLLTHLLDVAPDDPYGTLFRGSSRVLHGVTKAQGVAELERAIELAPSSPDVRWIVADAYTYGQPDSERALAEATTALDWGLDTPRIRAILGAAYNAFGDLATAATHIERHIELVTAGLVATPPLAAGDSLALDLVPGRTYEIPVAVTAGATIDIATSSHDFWDSIAVLIDPDGAPVVGSDDDIGYMAAFDHVAQETGTYLVRVSSFESIDTGVLVVARD